MLTFHRRPLTVVVVDRNFSSHTTSFRILGRNPAVAAEAGVVFDIVMMVEVVSVHHPGYLAADCRNRADWVVAVGFLSRRSS